MKKAILILLCTSFAIASNAQFFNNKDKKREKVEAIHVAYITNELNLSPEQAKDFWPIYNNLREDLKDVRRYKKEARAILDNEGSNDAAIQTAMDNIEKAQQQEMAIRAKYKPAFLKVISVRQLADLMEAEKQFQQMLMNRLNKKQGMERRGGKGPGMPPPPMHGGGDRERRFIDLD